MNFLDSNQLIEKEKSPLNKNISIVANHSVSQKINEDVVIAIRLIEDEMKRQNVNIHELKQLNLYLFRDRSLKMELWEPGNQIQFASINCDFLDRLEYQFRRVAIIVEEMIHFYWGITDEYEIKYIVLYIINFGWPKIEMDDLFDLTTIDKEKQIQRHLLSHEAFKDVLK